MSHRQIIIYNNGQGTTGSLVPALKEAFPANPPFIAQARHIHDGILDPARSGLFIQPGIAGETCNYTDELDTDALKKIYDFAHEGGIVLGICAGSYFFSRQTIYAPSWSAEKSRRSALPMFNGVARGPVSTHARQQTEEPRFGHVTVVPIDYLSTSGAWEKGGVCYGNGPGLYPDDPAEEGLEILARFSGAADAPAALLRKQIGKGAIYLSSILPEIGFQAIADIKGLETAKALMLQLEPHEKQRHDLWTMLTTRIKNDLGHTP